MERQKTAAVLYSITEETPADESDNAARRIPVALKPPAAEPEGEDRETSHVNQYLWYVNVYVSSKTSYIIDNLRIICYKTSNTTKNHALLRPGSAGPFFFRGTEKGILGTAFPETAPFNRLSRMRVFAGRTSRSTLVHLNAAP